MSDFHRRAYQGDADLAAMIELLRASRPADRLDSHPSPASLQELVADPSQRPGLMLWWDEGGRLAAFALVDSRFCNLYLEMRPDAAPLAGEMIAWAADYLPRSRLEAGLPVEELTLDASCRAGDRARLALLAEHGFQPRPERALRLARDLGRPIPSPILPPGFLIRPVTGEEEVDALVALHQAAFETENLSVDNRLSWMRTPDYEPELDLVAVGPEGRLAAYCFCCIYRADNALTGRSEGHTDPVATHPDFRRRGLATALLLAGLQRLRARGVAWAVMGTLNTNADMQRVAEGVGFELAGETLWFARPVSAARGQDAAIE